MICIAPGVQRVAQLGVNLDAGIRNGYLLMTLDATWLREVVMNTRHADVRAQQGGIPPMIEQLLDLYGQEEHDGRGAITPLPDKT